MGTFVNGKPIRERGGKANRPSREYRNSIRTKPQTTQTAVILEDAALRYEGSPVVETEETHLIPRISLTQKQHLRLFPQDVEVEPITLKRKQIDKTSTEVKSITVAVPVKTTPVIINGKETYHTTFETKTLDVKGLVETTDQTGRVVYKSDRTLLIPGVPQEDILGRRIKRLTSRSRRIKSDPDLPSLNTIQDDINQALKSGDIERARELRRELIKARTVPTIDF